MISTGSARTVLDGPARERIAAAIGRAEAATSAEIVVMVAGRVGRYRSVALLAALLVGLTVPWPLIWFTRWSAADIALMQAIVVLGLLSASLYLPLRIALTPIRMRRTQARQAARRAFWSRGLSRTKGRNGLLIHLALAERHAEIVADEGILERVERPVWDEALRHLSAALERGETEAGLIAAVEEVGQVLARVFPGSPDDVDELPNRVIVTG
ncbi:MULTISPECIES: TPM domain-containing protein [Methylobacterium]|uniref:TPM domain-containing protein n=2 Tax=Pseudomonadota TaxID=1224 RepID=A0ABQ4SSA9_9HYPH|nr:MULTISPECIES: TPM domain-containing protein [Methylobacterium]GBU19252.1 hypothetical protein AwMethylo_34670 [Methylobacterium sp.]GJE04745.1 hypothetical protein AOPFMNJM_0037 [Methylobacterium jeotgali]